MAAHGVSVIGFNSLKYFWNARKPDEMAHDLERTLTHYAAKWGADKFIVVGYSIGADVMPFMCFLRPKCRYCPGKKPGTAWTVPKAAWAG